MVANEIAARLAKLNRRQLQCLKLYCKGTDPKQIARKMGIAPGTVRVYLHQIYEKLGMGLLSDADRQRALWELFCPELNRSRELIPVEPDEPEETEYTREPNWEEVERKINTDVLSFANWQPSLSSGEPPSLPPPGQNTIIDGGRVPNGRSRTVMLLAIGLLIGVILSAVCLGGYLLGTGALSGGRQTSTAAILSTATPSPVSAPTTAQSSVPPRASPLATAEPSETAISATSTPAPSETQQNTPTTAATATASLVLPFQDNFDQGLRPEWRVVEGQPLMTGGRLQGADYTLTLQLGDAALEDYTVRFDTPNSCGSNNAGFILTVAERVQFEMRASYFVWRAFNGTDWTVLPSNNYLSCPHNVRITMASGKYTVAISNAIVLDAQYGTAIAGPLTISLKDHQPIDNFSLTNP